MQSPISHAPMKKATTFLTNSAIFHRTFHQARCQCKVAHKIIKGQEKSIRLSKHAQVYPNQLCSSIAACCAQECGTGS